MASKLSSRTIAEVTAELAHLREERERIDHAIVAIELFLSMVEEKPPAITIEPKSLRNAIYDLLRQTGRTLHYRDMMTLLADRGVTVTGKDPQRNILAHLSNDQRFISLGEGVWGLKVWQKNVVA